MTMKCTETMFKVLLGIALAFLLNSTRPVEVAGQVPCVEPAPGLVNWWPGDGNAEDIVGHRDGSLQNGLSLLNREGMAVDHNVDGFHGFR